MFSTTRRYEVRRGVPLSSTARITCATPAVVGMSVARGPLADPITSRGGGSRAPEAAGGAAGPAGAAAAAAGAAGRTRTGWPGMPVPASG